MLAFVGIQDDQRWSPFHAESVDHLLITDFKLKGNEVAFYSSANIWIGVGNSCQLLTPYSEAIVKVHQDQPLLLLRPFFRCG